MNIGWRPITVFLRLKPQLTFHELLTVHLVQLKMCVEVTFFDPANPSDSKKK